MMMMMMMDNGDGDVDGGDDDGDCGDDDGRWNEVIMVDFVFQFHGGGATIFYFRKMMVRLLNGCKLNLSNWYRLLPMTTLKTNSDSKLETVRLTYFHCQVLDLVRMFLLKNLFIREERRQERKWLTRRDKEEKDTWQSFLNNRGNNRK